MTDQLHGIPAGQRKSKRGGARKGAGRKSTGVVQINLLVRPETKRIIQRMARSQKRSQGQLLDEFVGCGVLS